MTNELQLELVNRFGEARVKTLKEKKEDDYGLLQLDLELRSPVKVILTNGLSSKDMPVPPDVDSPKRIELLFCLPSYWDFESLDSEPWNWPFEWILKLSEYLKECKTWLGHGHTFANGNPAKPLSDNMKCEYLMLTNPILLESFLFPVKTEFGEIHFLAVVPIHENEFDFKMNKGTFKFVKKFRAKNHDEIIDDFRESVFQKKWLFF